jgi:hypothetical protein
MKGRRREEEGLYVRFRDGQNIDEEPNKNATCSSIHEN